jgi:hypothetical protein
MPALDPLTNDPSRGVDAVVFADVVTVNLVPLTDAVRDRLVQRWRRVRS